MLPRTEDEGGPRTEDEGRPRTEDEARPRTEDEGRLRDLGNRKIRFSWFVFLDINQYSDWEKRIVKLLLIHSRRMTQHCVVEDYYTCSTEETILQNFIEIMKRIRLL